MSLCQHKIYTRLHLNIIEIQQEDGNVPLRGLHLASLVKI